jgi:Major Facilitator Superfamily
MTTQTVATAPSTPVGRRGRSLLTAPAVAGIAYTTAWVLGLAVWPSNLDVAASNVKVVATYSAHQGAAMTQYLLIEGLAAIALAVVVFALGRGARRRGADRLGQATVVAGLTAVAISLAQCALGLLLAGSVAPDGKTVQAGRLFDLINRMDGVKMFALAAMAVAGVGLVRRSGASPLAGLHRSLPDGGADCLRCRLSAAQHDPCSGGVCVRAAPTGVGDRGRRGPNPDEPLKDVGGMEVALRVGTDSRRWWALGAVTLAVLAESDLQWFQSGYLLVLAAAMLPAGLLGDRYGRKKVMLASLVLFGAGSAACAFAPSPGAFIAARALLALAGAGVIVMALSAAGFSLATGGAGSSCSMFRSRLSGSSPSWRSCRTLARATGPASTWLASSPRPRASSV